jgi:hypothetical protein
MVKIKIKATALRSKKAGQIEAEFIRCRGMIPGISNPRNV